MKALAMRHSVLRKLVGGGLLFAIIGLIRQPGPGEIRIALSA
jgi:hypothetical protein